MTRKTTHRKPQKSYPLLPIALGGVLLVFAFLAIISPGSESRAGSSSSAGTLNYEAPELSLQTLDGRTESLADYRGDVVLVNNWATWCPPCKAEMPTLLAYYNEHQAEGFTVIAIEAGGSADAVSEFAQSYDLTFPIWLDPNQASLRAFANSNLPNSYLIDRSGMVRYAWTGQISQAMLEQYVSPLLKKDS